MSITPIEQKIIELLEKEDERAINLLYEHYSNSLYGVILKITVNEEIAEDALQETFVNGMLSHTILTTFRGRRPKGINERQGYLGVAIGLPAFENQFTRMDIIVLEKHNPLRISRRGQDSKPLAIKGGRY